MLQIAKKKMRRSSRIPTTPNMTKSLKKQCLTRTAQRKFAANVPMGSPAKGAASSSNISTPKTEDFIDFLCFRGVPYLDPALEVFAEPMQIPDELHEEIFDSDEETLASVNYETEERSVASTGTIEEINDTPALTPAPSIEETEDEEIQMVNLDMIFVNPTQPSSVVFQDFFCLVDHISKKQQSIFVITPPTDWKTLSYVQDDLLFTIKTKHVHRLKYPVCENFITLQCIRKQLEKDNVKMNDIPLVGLCEIDLTYLMEIVDLFGGVDSVNSDQNWKALADQLCIPKSASRRAFRLEDIYMKYILPYALQCDSVKETIKQSVLRQLDKMKSIPKEYSKTKTVGIETFHRMACNAEYMYWKNGKSCAETENQFWKLINEGNRHITAMCGEIDLNTQPQSYEYSKHKTPWKLSNIYSHHQSALRHIGRLTDVSVPKLIVESVFWVSEWVQQPNGFHVLSYLHSGAEKVWYVIPEDAITHFENLQSEAEEDRSFLSPELLLSKGCQVKKVIQREGQYVIVQPCLYYCTLCTGYAFSETVCFAPRDWFVSRYFREHKIEVDDYVVVKSLLNFSIEDVNTNLSGYNDFAKVLICKLDELSELVAVVLTKLTGVGITKITYMKTKPNKPDECTSCHCVCYLFTVEIENNEELLLCVDDALKLLRGKSYKAKSMSVSALISINKINQLKEKLQTCLPPKKKKK